MVKSKYKIKFNITNYSSMYRYALYYFNENEEIHRGHLNLYGDDNYAIFLKLIKSKTFCLLYANSDVELFKFVSKNILNGRDIEIGKYDECLIHK